MSAFLVLALTFGLMYVFFMRPQAKRVKAQRELLRAVEVGDQVMLTSGLYGTIVEVDDADDVIWLEVAEDVELKVARGAVSKRISRASDADADHMDADEDDEADAIDAALLDEEVVELAEAGPVDDPVPADDEAPRPDPSDPR